MRLSERVTRAVWGGAMDIVERRVSRTSAIGAPRAQPVENPTPVILMAGYGNTPAAMGAIGRSLQRDGFRHVTYLPAPEHGMASAAVGVDLLRATVRRVKAETGSGKVDLVAHSRNGQVAREHLRQGGDAHVGRLVTVTSANHGVKWGPLERLVPEGMKEISVRSPMMQRLNAGDMAPPGVQHTAISTGGWDLVMIPPSSGRLPDAPNVTNVVVDEGRRLGPISRVSHYGVLTDERAYDAVRAALTTG